LCTCISYYTNALYNLQLFILLIVITIGNRGGAQAVAMLGNYVEIVFTCLAQGFPSVDRMWWNTPFNGSVLSETRFDHLSAISVMLLNGTMEYKHSGQYVCHASNSLIKRYFVFQVVVKGELYDHIQTVYTVTTKYTLYSLV